jgi:hypothetical protein
MSDFGVFVVWAKGTPEIWQRVEETPRGKLPRLTAEQKETAKRRGISDEDYQRSVLHQELAEERLHKWGETLGEAAKPVLNGLGQSYQLRAVLIDDSKDRWALRIETPEGMKEVVLPLELRERLLASGDQEALRQELLTGLGRKDLVVHR